MLSDRVALEAINDGMSDMLSGRGVRTMVDMRL